MIKGFSRAMFHTLRCYETNGRFGELNKEDLDKLETRFINGSTFDDMHSRHLFRRATAITQNLAGMSHQDHMTYLMTGIKNRSNKGR